MYWAGSQDNLDGVRDLLPFVIRIAVVPVWTTDFMALIAASGVQADVLAVAHVLGTLVDV